MERDTWTCDRARCVERRRSTEHRSTADTKSKPEDQRVIEGRVLCEKFPSPKESGVAERNGRVTLANVDADADAD